MTLLDAIWKGRLGWVSTGFAAGAASMAGLWGIVGTRTPPQPIVPTTRLVLPYRDPVEGTEVVFDPSPVVPASVPRAVTEPAPEPVATRTPVTEPAPEPVATRSPVTEPVARQPAASLRINLNAASEAELDLLPGIGPALAKRIIDERARGGRFTSLRDLQRVRGIGPRTAEKLEGLVVFE